MEDSHPNLSSKTRTPEAVSDVIRHELARENSLQHTRKFLHELVSHTTVRYKADESSMELNALTGLLRNAITKTSDNYAKARHGDEIYSMLIDYYNEIGGDKPAEVDLCRFTSWCGFPYYEIDFGWGKPSWIATPSKFVEIVFLYDTKCGDGIEAWVTLNEDDMVEFECRYQPKSLGTKALYQQRSLRSAM